MDAGEETASVLHVLDFSADVFPVYFFFHLVRFRRVLAQVFEKPRPRQFIEGSGDENDLATICGFNVVTLANSPDIYVRDVLFMTAINRIYGFRKDFREVPHT